MLVRLSPYVRRQAKRLCRHTPSLVEDAYSEGRLRIWELLQKGVEDEAYLLRCSANRIRNFLAHESYEPTPLTGDRGTTESDADPIELFPDVGPAYEEALCRVWLGTLAGTLQSALEKELFTREAKTAAERVALCRFRRSEAARELADGLCLS